jgi:Domain of unknown function (DUF4148)
MKTLTLKSFAITSSVVTLTALSVMPVSADTSKVDYSNLSNFESTKSRDQVREEYMQAMKAGTLPRTIKTEVDADSPTLAKTAPSTLQRQAVTAATIEWMRTQTAEVGMGE